MQISNQFNPYNTYFDPNNPIAQTNTTPDTKAVTKAEPQLAPLAPWQEKFIEAALERMKRVPVPPVQLPEQNDAFIKTVKSAVYDHAYTSNGQGGEHRWVATKDVPGFLFKSKLPKDYQCNTNMIARAALAEEGRKICEEYDLYLLYVPQSALLTSDEKVLIEEKLDIKHEWREQKNLYRWVISEPRLESYAKEFLRQLIIFIVKMRYNDVKYINNPLTNDGRVGLIDLDKRGYGFVGFEKFHGIFHIIPLKWWDEYASQAISLLSETDREYYSERIAKLKTYYTDLEKDRAAVQSFYANKQITNHHQPVQFDENLLKDQPDLIAKCAKMLIQQINTDINHTRKGLKKGRRLDFKDTQLPRGVKDYWEFRLNILPKTLEILKNLGIIYSYWQDRNTANLQVVF